MSAQDLPQADADSDATFERAKLPMVLAAVGVAAGLAIAGSVHRVVGGVVVLAAWVIGIFALHRLGRAGSAVRLQAPGSRLQPDENEKKPETKEPEPPSED